ncbi:MAG: hypothetical protein ACQKBV_07735 [Puniceicoccales bacterium]
MLTRGILYGVTGQKYIAEAAQSARFVRKYMPGIPIAIAAPQNEWEGDEFDEYIKLPEPCPGFLAKVSALSLSPWEQTLFLDSDAYIIHSCTEIFDLLDNFDIALAHDPWRNGHDVGVPDAFPEFNSGVIAYNMEACRDMLKDWEAEFRKHCESDPRAPDQATLRKVMYHSRLRIAPMPMEYNFRAGLPSFAGANAAVKLIHWRTNDPEGLGYQINATLDYRAIFQSVENFDGNTVILSSGGKSIQSLLRLISRLRRFTRGQKSSWDITRAKVFETKRQELELD